jgi:hypothetical protein
MVYNARALRLSNETRCGFSTNAVMPMTPPGRIACMRLTQLAIGALAFGLIAAPAWAQDDETTSEDELTRSSTSLNSNSLRGRSQSLNSLDAGKADELEEMDTGRADGLDQVDTGQAATLDAVDNGASSTIEQVDRRWQPPRCDGTLPAGMHAPSDASEEGWTVALEEAQDKLTRSQRKWRSVETGAVVPKYDTLNPQIRQIQRDKLIQESRDDYAEARCGLVGMLEQARRAGVAPGVLRPYRVELPADLRD